MCLFTHKADGDGDFGGESRLASISPLTSGVVQRASLIEDLNAELEILG